MATTISAPRVRKNDIFVSYSRRDKAFVQQLDTAFRNLSRDPWIDWDDIREAEEWRKAIARGIVAADTFIFVISPDSVASEECGKELMQAIEHNKRIIPIVYRETNPNHVHPVLAELNWIFFRETDNFDTAFQKLMQAISTNLPHVQTHTRLLGRATEWEEHGRDDGFLLRGKDLATAEAWLVNVGTKEPVPTELHKRYINKSREVEAANLRLAEAGRKAKQIMRFSFGISIAALLASGIATAIVLYTTNQTVANLNAEQKQLTQEIQAREADIAKLDAIQQQLTADRQILIAALKEFGWTEASINDLLASNSQTRIVNAVEQAVQANSIYQDAIDQKSQFQTESQPNLLPSPSSQSETARTQPSVTVEYYPQNIDPATVERALTKLGFTLKVDESINQPDQPINTIFYSQDVDQDLVKLVAYCLIRAGIEITSIQPIADDGRTATIRVGSQSDAQAQAPLTVKTIRNSNLPIL
jgi:hypothetical protein